MKQSAQHGSWGHGTSKSVRWNLLNQNHFSPEDILCIYIYVYIHLPYRYMWLLYKLYMYVMYLQSSTWRTPNRYFCATRVDPRGSLSTHWIGMENGLKRWSDPEGWFHPNSRAPTRWKCFRFVGGWTTPFWKILVKMGLSSLNSILGVNMPKIFELPLATSFESFTENC